MIGSGPWMLDQYTPSVSWQFKMNPNWWMKGIPLLDGLEYDIIPAYASRLAPLQAGSTDTEGQLAVADLIDLKKSSKNYIIRGAQGINTSMFYFDGHDPTEPWGKDDRVRQAVAMSIDRDALTELLYDVKKLAPAFTGNFKGITYGPESAFTEAGAYPIRMFTDNPLNHGKIKDQQLAACD